MRDCILLVTGRKAAPTVETYSGGRVHVHPVDVAALISMDRLGEELSRMSIKGVSMVIIPGLISGDTSSLSSKLGIPVYKGTKSYSDIPLLLENIGKLRLSTTLPADGLLEEENRKKAELKLKDASKSGRNALLKIGRMNPAYVGGKRPMCIVAEIPDAPCLPTRELKAMAVYYVRSGAGIVDLGMVSGLDNSGKIGAMIDAVRSVVKTPVSLDSMNEREITAAVDAGVDLVLSVGLNNVEVAGSIDVPFVVVPLDGKGRLPETASGRMRNIELILQRLDGKDVILDAVLSPLNHGFVESIKAFAMVKERHPNVPVLMGAGNVTELVDADSVGVNALLAGIAHEIGAEMLFTVEASPKTRGCVLELSTAAKLMYLAGRQSKSPKDLGLSLLKLKDKRTSAEEKTPHLKYIHASARQTKLDGLSYRIQIKGSKIRVVEYKNRFPTRGFEGQSAEALYKTICSKSKISPEHAAYLGKELAKAEMALKLGKNYVQDENLF